MDCRERILSNENGMILVKVIILAGLISGIAVYFSSRAVRFQKNASQISVKTDAIVDRKIIEFELANRPIPVPGS